MLQEDRNLLKRDLCGRLPYGVICSTSNGDGHLCSIDQTIYGSAYGVAIENILYFDEQCIKPYLRPMSSMTEEEVKELVKIEISKYALSSNYRNIVSIDRISSFDEHSWSVWLHFKAGNGDIHQTCFIVGRVNWETTLAEIDWLNSHHFDYRGLIEKGLALEAPKDMYEDLNNERRQK